jgi:hypothetical protein
MLTFLLFQWFYNTSRMFSTHSECKSKTFPVTLKEYKANPSTKLDILIDLVHRYEKHNELVFRGQAPQKEVYDWNDDIRSLEIRPEAIPLKSTGVRSEKVKIIVYAHFVSMYAFLLRVSGCHQVNNIIGADSMI